MSKSAPITPIGSTHISTEVPVTRFLKDPRVAMLVVDALRHFDDLRYRLHAWCVMPNHVHVVFSSMPARTPALRLSKIIQSWKSYTAKEANRLLARTGPFWQREYYDHLVRDEADFVRCIDYTIKQPGQGWAVRKMGRLASERAAPD
jgi:REP element-mobilizing transposase RayT